MATRHASAVKAHRQTIKRTEHNRELRSKLRTGLKNIRAAIDAGHLPALARLRAEGSSHVVTTVFPSASLCRDSFTRVRVSVSPSTFEVVTGSTLPNPLLASTKAKSL